MPTLCKPYESPAEADRAVSELQAAGVPGEHIRVLMGARVHDARTERSGSFGGSIDLDATPGGFAGETASGAARGGFAGDATARPQGVFANSDRDVVVTYADGAEQARVAGHRQLEGLLMDAGLDAETAAADVRALHDGRILLLVHVATIGADEARSLLDGAVAQQIAG